MKQKLKQYLSKKNYELFFKTAMKYGGFVWNSLLRDAGLTPASIKIMLKRLKTDKLIFITPANEKEKLKQVLIERGINKSALSRFTPYKLVPSVVEELEQYGFKYSVFKEYEIVNKDSSKIHKVELGKCVICGKPIIKTTYFTPKLIEIYGNETTTGIMMPVDESLNKWDWYCNECSLNDPHLRELRRMVVKGLIKEVKKVKLKCPMCGYEWNYRGQMLWVTCPNCMGKFRREVEQDENKSI